MIALADDGIIFFYQTDRRYKGQIIDKKSIISNHFLNVGKYNNVFSKIILTHTPHTINFYRPTYSNLFAFSKKQTSYNKQPDVIMSGKKIYKNAMGYNAITLCIDYLKKKDIKGTIIDPFCGKGSVLKIANDFGYNAIGVDIEPQHVKKSVLL